MSRVALSPLSFLPNKTTLPDTKQKAVGTSPTASANCWLRFGYFAITRRIELDSSAPVSL
jgi:hypothetical protein